MLPLIDDRSAGQEEFDDREVAFARGHDERIAVARNGKVDVGAAFEEEADDRHAAFACGGDQR